jgi:hypothetical protein
MLTTRTSFVPFAGTPRPQGRAIRFGVSQDQLADLDAMRTGRDTAVLRVRYAEAPIKYSDTVNAIITGLSSTEDTGQRTLLEATLVQALDKYTFPELILNFSRA